MEDDRAVQRRLLLDQEVARYLGLLLEFRNPERVILFGSLASGEVGPWSDIDLVVVMDTDKPFWERLKETRRLLQPRVGADILVYTPQEFERLCRDRSFFREGILRGGKVLYERGA